MFEQSTVRRDGRGGRSVGGGVASVAVHLVAAIGAILIAQAAPAKTPRFLKSALTYIALSTPVAMPAEPIVLREEVRLKPDATDIPQVRLKADTTDSSQEVRLKP